LAHFAEGEDGQQRFHTLGRVRPLHVSLAGLLLLTVLAVAGPAAAVQPTTLTLAPGDGALLGKAVSTSMTLAGGADPAGTIQVRAYGPGDKTCTGSPAYSDSVPVDGNGSYGPLSFTPTAVGIYRWTASYGGDGANAASAVGCTGPTTVVSGRTGQRSVARQDFFSGPWQSSCIQLRPTDNDRIGGSGSLWRLSSGPSFGRIYRYDADAVGFRGAAVGSGETVPAGIRLCYKTNSTFFSGSDSMIYQLVDPALTDPDDPTLVARTPGVVVQISVIETRTVRRDPAPRATATAGDHTATLTAPVAFDAVDAYVDGLYVGRRPFSATGPHVVTGLVNGLPYSFALWNGGAYVGHTDDVVPHATPGEPTDVTIGRSAGDVVVSWTAPADLGEPALTGYRVEYSVDGVAQTALTVTGTTTSLAGIDDDESVVATVTAVTAEGDGPDSAPVTLHPVVTHLEVVAPSTASPGVPVDVDVRAVDAGGDTATWFTGEVHFASTDATATLPTDTELVDGAATVAVTFADPGTQTLTATGGGVDGTSDEVTVSQVSPSVSLDLGDDVELGATITAVAGLADGLHPTGTITFRVFGPDDADCSDPAAFSRAVDVTGNGDYESGTFTPLERGHYPWTATYSGDDDNATSATGCSSSVVVSERPGAPTGLDLSRGTEDTVDVAWTAPADEGLPALSGYRIEYSVDGADQTPVSVTGTGTTATLTGITDDERVVASVTATGPAGDGTASGSATLQPVITHLEVDVPTTATPGVEVDVDVRAVDAGGETATWFAGDVHLTSSDATAILPDDGPLTDGEGTFTVTFADPGTHTVTVTGGGVEGTSDDVSVATVVPTLAVDPDDAAVLGSPVAATADLAAGLDPGGTLTFRAYGPADTACSGAPAFTAVVAVAGNATYGSGLFAAASAGDYAWSAAYSGDDDNSPVTTACTETTTVTAPPPVVPLLVVTPDEGTGTVGLPLTATATLTGGAGPAGEIRVQVFGPGSDCSGRVVATSAATVTGNGSYPAAPYVPEAAGAHHWRATYSGSSGNVGVTSECSAAVEVEGRPTTTSLTGAARSDVGDAVTLRATVEPADVGGAVTFRDGGAVLGTAPIHDGAAEIAVVFSTAGDHQLVAEYDGDERSAPSSSEVAVHVVVRAEPVVPAARVVGTRLHLEHGVVRIRVRCTSQVACDGSIQLRRAGRLLGRTVVVSLEPGASVTAVQPLSRRARHQLHRACGPVPASVRIGLRAAGPQSRLVWHATKVTVRARSCGG
jgi:hypothetical protein